ncbi:GNAT family N-acetyltransferase [Demequina sp. TTPB684]|uniref:GNAT family N-acetyltransferase n=1 Tax=unclassified Demequina TaxID=2620311 RepID=UPI001CF5D51C|nr:MULTISPECIES: GNAT family N-acetyltransferase [unclassified Demequina]MCB2412045.1 GNAT family N-acetyltransferase [Demequina sp. TTPB684]UPU88029.1 GNAT family N-acetyltransferase [Demequina sp. TMPB413]
MTTPRIRPATPADEQQMARVCLLTGADGGDAAGRFGDDTVLADVYASPYLHGPSCSAWVVDVGGKVLGYVVAAADTEEFQRWFSTQWWPERGERHVAKTADDGWLLPAAADPERCLSDAVAEYPAHLHIDLLPELQGAGWGRRLMDTLMAQLAEQGVDGVHLVAPRANEQAQAFYPKVGFVAVGEDEKNVTFARHTILGGGTS